MIQPCFSFKTGAKSFVCSILRQIAFSPQLHASAELYDDSHRQDKQLRDGWMKCTALFARLDVLLSGVVLVQEARCEDEDDGWVLGCRKNAESYAVDFVFCSVITSVFHVSVPVFLFKLFTMSLQRCLTTLVNSCTVSLLCDAGCSVGDSCHFSCLRTLSRSTEILCSLSISVLTWRRRAMIFLRLSVSCCMASRVLFINCTSFILTSIPHEYQNDNDERVHQTIVYRWTTKLWPALSK